MATVLIVDDSPTELHVFQKMLEKNGFLTLVADSGDEGIRQAKSALPDCILMDVVMPGMNGFQATRAITRDDATSHIPVIIVTTKSARRLSPAWSGNRLRPGVHPRAGQCPATWW